MNLSIYIIHKDIWSLKIVQVHSDHIRRGRLGILNRLTDPFCALSPSLCEQQVLSSLKPSGPCIRKQQPVRLCISRFLLNHVPVSCLLHWSLSIAKVTFLSVEIFCTLQILNSFTTVLYSWFWDSLTSLL